jgi:hypothetical protein
VRILRRPSGHVTKTRHTLNDSRCSRLAFHTLRALHPSHVRCASNSACVTSASSAAPAHQARCTLYSTSVPSLQQTARALPSGLQQHFLTAESHSIVAQQLPEAASQSLTVPG